MSFTVIGDLLSTGMPASLSWSEARGFFGDAAALADIDSFIHESRLVPLSATGPWVEPDRTDPRQATALAGSVMRNIEAVEGELPALPDFGVPPGAIA